MRPSREIRICMAIMVNKWSIEKSRRNDSPLSLRRGSTNEPTETLVANHNWSGNEKCFGKKFKRNKANSKAAFFPCSRLKLTFIRTYTWFNINLSLQTVTNSNPCWITNSLLLKTKWLKLVVNEGGFSIFFCLHILPVWIVQFIDFSQSIRFYFSKLHPNNVDGYNLCYSISSN